jgi:hypothetical protein
MLLPWGASGYAESVALTRCTVLLPTPWSAAIFRMPARIAGLGEKNPLASPTPAGMVLFTEIPRIASLSGHPSGIVAAL